MGPGTHLEKRLKRDDPCTGNWLDRLAKQRDIDYNRSRNLREEHEADRKMIRSIECLPSKKTLTERVVKNIMKTEVGLKI